MALFEFLKHRVQLDSNLDRIKKLAGIQDNNIEENIVKENSKIEEDELNEAAPPGMEKWIKKNKKIFIKKYGKKRGMRILYATAWKMHNKSIKENVSYSLPYNERLELAAGRYHNLAISENTDLDPELIEKAARENRVDPDDLESYLRNE